VRGLSKQGSEFKCLFLNLCVYKYESIPYCAGLIKRKLLIYKKVLMHIGTQSCNANKALELGLFAFRENERQSYSVSQRRLVNCF